MSKVYNDGGYDWFCDKCNAYMNHQRGFTIQRGSWHCTKCGALNSVGLDNVIDLLGAVAKGIQEFKARPLDDPEEDD